MADSGGIAPSITTFHLGLQLPRTFVRRFGMAEKISEPEEEEESTIQVL
jgi:hypothetical protein